VPQADTEQWTTLKLLEWMTDCFEKNEIESPRLISEMLLTHLFGGHRIDLYANVTRVATDAERETLRSYVKRTLEHEPVQFIVGKTWFNGMEFLVNDSTLIPRTCTETVVEQALHYAKQTESSPVRIADIGTGTGCIAITIAVHLKDIEIIATDISSEALSLAEKNAKSHGVQHQITFIEGDGLGAITSLPPFDIICSNPPYIPDEEMDTLDPNVAKWEPKLALSGGKDGLDIIRPLLEQSGDYLTQNGVLLVEIASSIRDKVLELATENPAFKETKILRDRYGDDRFLRAIKC
jgi:release factor glutamine methyltransferase